VLVEVNSEIAVAKESWDRREEVLDESGIEWRLLRPSGMQ